MTDLSRDALIRMERCRHERTVPHPEPPGGWVRTNSGLAWRVGYPSGGRGGNRFDVVRCVDCGLPLEQRV